MTALIAQLDLEPADTDRPQPTGIASMAPSGGVALRIA